MTRRLLLAGIAAATLTQTGCCGRVRSFFYRITHPCAGGFCSPAFGGYDHGPMVPSYAAGPVFDGGPVGAPGCSTCYSGGPPAMEAMPVGGAFPVVPPPGYMMGGPPGGIVQGVPQQMVPPSGGPGVFNTPAEPPGGKK